MEWALRRSAGTPTASRVRLMRLAAQLLSPMFLRPVAIALSLNSSSHFTAAEPTKSSRRSRRAPRLSHARRGSWGGRQGRWRAIRPCRQQQRRARGERHDCTVSLLSTNSSRAHTPWPARYPQVTVKVTTQVAKAVVPLGMSLGKWAIQAALPVRVRLPPRRLRFAADCPQRRPHRPFWSSQALLAAGEQERGGTVRKKGAPKRSK